MRTIFVLDDEPDILELVQLNLTRAGFAVNTFETAGALLESLKTTVPDLLVLDLMLPDMDGLEVCSIIRQRQHIRKLPIIMLTARIDTDNRITGLEAGADDYITKPFSPQELVARINSLFRRKDWESDGNVLSIGDGLRIDFLNYEVYLDEKRLDLTRTEFKILQLLTRQQGRVYSRSEILDFLWGNEKIVIDRTIDVHIRHLREKLARYGEYIQNIRHQGYKFELDTPEHG